MAQILGKYFYEFETKLSKSVEDLVNRVCPPKEDATTFYPTLEISKNESEEWTINIDSFIDIGTEKFRLGEEYDREIKYNNGSLKLITTLEDNRLVTHAVERNDLRLDRTFEFSDIGCVMTLYNHDGSKFAPRLFKRQKMEPYLGKFLHERNKNLDEYLEAVGVPYIQRKIMCASHPTLEISKSESEEWTITISSLFNTQIVKFRLYEEYEEHMPEGVFKSVTGSELRINRLYTKSVGPHGEIIYFNYQFSQTGNLILSMTYKVPGDTEIEATRYFKRQD